MLAKYWRLKDTNTGFNDINKTGFFQNNENRFYKQVNERIRKEREKANAVDTKLVETENQGWMVD